MGTYRPADPTDPADFDADTPPPRTRLRGEPLPRHVELPRGEPIPELFAGWDRSGRVPAGAVLAQFVGTGLAGAVSGYRTPDGVAVPAAELERYRIAHWVRHADRPRQTWVVLVPRVPA